MVIEKALSALTIDDFSSGSIWTWADDDDNNVKCIRYQDSLPEEYDALFIGCDFILNDGSHMRGVVFVRISDHQIYSLAMPLENGKLIDIPLQSPLKGLQQIQSEKVVSSLQKPIDEIFPITFVSPFVFSDGVQLEGVINLEI